MDIKSLGNAMELFRLNNWMGTDNCIFVAYKDASAETAKAGVAGALGGAVGGAITAFASGMEQGMNSKELGLGSYSALLINQTEHGIGLMPFYYKGLALTLNIDKMELDQSKFTVIKNEELQNITVKNYNIFNKKTKKIKITLKNRTVLKLMARINEKTIPYQTDSMNKLISRYGK
jgi:hypothetical protein